MFASFQEWFNAGGLPALLITIGCAYLAVKVTSAVIRTIVSIVAALAAVYVLCPQLYFQLADWIATGIGAISAISGVM